MDIIEALGWAGAIAMCVPRLTGLAALCFVALNAVTITLAIGGGILVAMPAGVGCSP